MPTPCIDVTYSPYIALFFAFNELDHEDVEANSDPSVVYAMNLDALAHGWVKRIRKRDYAKERQNFLSPDLETKFKKCFPANELFFMPTPGSHNSRMIRQQGAFIYDTIDHSAHGDLEKFIEDLEDLKIGSKVSPAVKKLKISKRCVSDVLSRLELMGINAGMLYMDPAGAAMDVKNSYFYNPRTPYLRDVRTASHCGGCRA